MTTLLITAIMLGLFGYGLWRTRNAEPAGSRTGGEDRDAARVRADLHGAGARPAVTYVHPRIPAQGFKRSSTRSTLASSWSS